MSNASSYKLARFYLELQDMNWPAKFGTVIDEYVQCTGINLCKYSLNYKPLRRFDRETLLRELNRRSLADFEMLSVEEQEGALGLHTVATFGPLDVAGVYEYVFAFRSNQDFTNQFTVLAESMARAGELLYGYGRGLSSDCEPVSESRMIRSFFGGIAVKGQHPVKEWLEHPREIREGAIKGIYGLNLISSRRAQKPIPWLGADKIQSAVRVSDCLLVQLSKEELARAKTRKDIGRFVREDMD